MRIRPSNGAIALTAGLAAAVLCGPLLLRGDRAANAEAEANRRAIAGLTETERQRLERNFQRWQKLTPEQQQQWREFDAQLRGQAVQLNPVLEDYCDWLETIPGYRRQELLNTAELTAKVDLVHEIVGEQLADRLEAPTAAAAAFGGPFSPGLLTSAELDSLFEVLESKLPQAEVSKLTDREGSPLTGLERHLRLVPLIGRGLVGNLPFVQSSETMRQILDALPPRFSEEIVRGPERVQPAQIRNRLAAIIFVSVRAELERAVRTAQPTPDQLQTHFASLPPQLQEQLLGLSAEDFARELSRRWYLAQLQTRVEVDLDKLRGVFELREPGRDGPPGGERPYLNGGPGDRMRLNIGGRPFSGERPFNGERPFGPDGERRPGDGRPPFGDRPGEGARPFAPGDGAPPSRPEDGRPPREEVRPPPPRDGERPPNPF